MRTSRSRPTLSWPRRVLGRWAASRRGRHALGVVGIILALYPLTSGESLPVHRGDLCALFAEKADWYRAMESSAQRWNVSIAVQMAIMKHESNFYSKARPPRRRLFGIVPWKRPSTAYGYGQVLDATWEDFRQQPGQGAARRDRFVDVAQFMGWYLHRLHHATGLPKDDAYGLYLAYHEGPGGYARGSYQNKAWLLRTAQQVARQSQLFGAQLETCDQNLRRRHLLRTLFLWFLLATLGVWLWRRHRR